MISFLNLSIEREKKRNLMEILEKQKIILKFQNFFLSLGSSYSAATFPLPSISEFLSEIKSLLNEINGRMAMTERRHRNREGRLIEIM